MLNIIFVLVCMSVSVYVYVYVCMVYNEQYRLKHYDNGCRCSVYLEQKKRTPNLCVK